MEERIYGHQFKRDAITKVKNEERIEEKYFCGFCKFNFKHWVYKSGEGKKSASTQVICPRCTNFVKTWK